MSETNLLVNTVGIITALLAVIYAYFKWSYTYWERKCLPFLKPSFPLGNLENPLKKKLGPGPLFATWYNTFKAKGYRHGGVYTINSPRYVPVDPEIIKCIITKDFKHFVDRGMFGKEDKHDILTTHLFAVGGTRWKNLRTKLTPTFTSGKMKQMFETIVECGRSLQSSMDQKVKEGGQEVDIKEYLASYTLDVIGSCAFGLEFNAINDPNSPFRRHAKNITHSTLWRGVKGLFVLAFPKLAPMLGVRRLDNSTANFFQELVRDTVNYRETKHYTRQDFMQLLIELKNNGTGMGIDDIASNTFLFFVAGFETSSTAMTFCLYELAKYPDLQAKARAEIREVLERHEGILSYEAVSEMKYLAQVLDEALRIYPSLSFLARTCTEDYKIPDSDVILERGTPVTISVLGLHRDPDNFPDPMTFDPDRFSEENKAKIKPFTYLPFGDGPRNCIGLRFGLLQSKVGLASLLKEFEFSLNPRTKTSVQLSPRGLFLAAQGGIWLDVKRVE